ncbi:hypothetical protein [Peribacillus frigoritolerans]|uniref:hypothetical protein n=1 Tax=Peribacillus frigoritolerans TaxID=450367 RepID=UPI0039A2C230
MKIAPNLHVKMTVDRSLCLLSKYISKTLPLYNKRTTIFRTIQFSKISTIHFLISLANIHRKAQSATEEIAKIPRIAGTHA